MAAAAIMTFENFKILTVCSLYGANLRQFTKFHQNRSAAGDTWRFKAFQNGGRPPCWISDLFQFFNSVGG